MGVGVEVEIPVKCARMIKANVLNTSNHAKFIRSLFCVISLSLSLSLALSLSRTEKLHAVITETSRPETGTYAIILPNLGRALAAL